MALYELSEFLTFDDVAEYLTDKGVYDFDLSDDRDWQRLKDFLIQLARAKKITPVFYNRSAVDVVSYQYNETNKPIIKFIEGSIGLDGYYSIDDISYETILNNGILKASYIKNYTDEEYDNENILMTQGYSTPTNIGFGADITRVHFEPYKLSEEYKPKTLENHLIHYGLFAGDSTIIRESEILYPKSELDKLFLQQQRDNLQSQTDVLDNQLNDKELPPNSQKAVAKLLYALLKEHKYELGTTKGATNDILENLTEKHGVKLARETIAKWLNAVNDLNK